MKTQFIKLPMLLVFLWVSVTATFAQSLYSNQPCKENGDCKSGICLKLRSGDYVCGTCSQSTFDRLAPKVDEYCKSFGNGWRPEKAPEYLAMEVDGRVQVEVYDEMLEKAKACRDARKELQKECFEGGESYDKYDHAGQIRAIETSISDLAAHKTKMIGDNRVYYCSKSTYEGGLRQYESKCGRLDFNQVKQKYDAANYALGKGLKTDCDLLEDWDEKCEECELAARDLIKYGFRDNSSYTPDEFADKKEKAEEWHDKFVDLMGKIKSKSLCD